MSKVLKKITAIMLTLAMVVTICPQGKLISIKAADAEDNTPYNLSKGRPAYASSQTGSGLRKDLQVTEILQLHLHHIREITSG